MIADQLPALGAKAFGADPGLTAATDYNTGVLGGKYLSGNPQLDAIISQTGNDVRDRVSAQFTSAGRTGSGANTYTLGKALSANEAGLRYQDYDAERQRMAQAAALAPTLNSAQYSGLGAYLSAAQTAAGIPLDAARSYASGLGALYSPYATQTTKSSPSIGAILAQAAANAASAYAGGG